VTASLISLALFGAVVPATSAPAMLSMTGVMADSRANGVMRRLTQLAVLRFCAIFVQSLSDNFGTLAPVSCL
jgi:hypothetical protein